MTKYRAAGQALADALRAAGFPVLSERDDEYAWFGWPPHGTGHTVLLVPLDPTAPGYAQELATALAELRRTADLGSYATAALRTVARAESSGGRYIDKDGQPIDLLTWGRLVEDEEYCTLAQTTVGESFVLTKYHGDILPACDRQPFGTAVNFREVALYDTKEAALAGHAAIVGNLRRTAGQKRLEETEGKPVT